MITRIEASGYRCLRSIAQELEPFQILVGPNGSGKSAFLDVLAFLGTAISEGLEVAVKERTENFYDLVWGREGSSFELAIEAKIPEYLPVAIPTGTAEAIRYEVKIGLDPGTEMLVFAEENIELRAAEGVQGSGIRIVKRDQRSVDVTWENGQPGSTAVANPSVSALRTLTEPRCSRATSWLTNLLSTGITWVKLDVNELRKPSPPQQGPLKQFTGVNLARTVNQLKENNPQNFEAWLAHLRTSLPDLGNIRLVLRPEDRHRYLMVRQTNGVEVPSWALSEGTLRLLALTVFAYLPDFQGIYLIEEPENGVHPTAIETIYQSLSSIYEGQVMVASHSPILLSLAKPQDLLCFTKTAEGTEIVRGSEHPALRDWRGEVNLSDLFAAGVLG
jgi:predicted ATPase